MRNHAARSIAVVFIAISTLALSTADSRAADSAPADSRPNIVVILADDQGWGDLSLHDNPNVVTPRIDSLARDGATLEHFFVCAVCSPTRAEFLTGRYHPRGGVRGTSVGQERLDLDEQTIAEFFQAAGYATGAFGKWHNGTQYPYHPNARGFEEYYGFCSGHWGHYFDPPLEHNGKLVRGQGYITDDITSHGLEFIRHHADRPFFCYLAYNTPHSPFQVPDRFFDPLAERDLAKRHRDPEKEDPAVTRAALAMCENIDWNVGRVLDQLDELELAENTIVFYFSDNGPNSWRYNGDMKGRKGSIDEGGLRVPALMRWPATIEPGTRIEPIAGAIDLLPTFAELANVPLEPERALDGTSLAPLLKNPEAQWPERMLFSHWRGRVSVRTDQYRLDHQGKLFDMHRDPGQREDISSAQPEVTAMLTGAVRRWREEVLTDYEADDTRPFPVGYSQMPDTPLPARDATFSGNVERSARAPNCSFLTHWTSTDDRITWDVEVATQGRYEATIYYTCPRADIGATFELSFGDAHVEAAVTEAHDPPLRGAEADRVGRGSESYVKDFQSMRIGEIELKAARGPLTLRALEVPGAQVMDVRAVVLRLLP